MQTDRFSRVASEDPLACVEHSCSHSKSPFLPGHPLWRTLAWEPGPAAPAGHHQALPLSAGPERVFPGPPTLGKRARDRLTEHVTPLGHQSSMRRAMLSWGVKGGEPRQEQLLL